MLTFNTHRYIPSTLNRLDELTVCLQMCCIYFQLSNKYTKKELDAYAHAGSIAEETISSIRTVVAFGMQDEQDKRYARNRVCSGVTGNVPCHDLISLLPLARRLAFCRTLFGMQLVLCVVRHRIF